MVRQARYANINQRKQDAPNIAPLGEVSAEKMERLFGQPTPKPPAKADPAPSRTKYKMQRLWLTPMIRSAVRAGVPVLTVLGIGFYGLSNDDLRTRFLQTIEDTRANIEARPEFQVELMRIDGASRDLASLIRKTLNLDLPLNSFDLDMADIKDRIEQLDGVKSAELFLRSDSLLEVKITERIPVIAWRRGRELDLLDVNGERTGVITSRMDRRDLPLIAGEAAEEHISEALTLYAIAEPIWSARAWIAPHGIESRWDMMLDYDQVIQLPEKNPIEALNRVLAMHDAQKILDPRCRTY